MIAPNICYVLWIAFKYIHLWKLLSTFVYLSLTHWQIQRDEWINEWIHEWMIVILLWNKHPYLAHRCDKKKNGSWNKQKTIQFPFSKNHHLPTGPQAEPVLVDAPAARRQTVEPEQLPHGHDPGPGRSRGHPWAHTLQGDLLPYLGRSFLVSCLCFFLYLLV